MTDATAIDTTELRRCLGLFPTGVTVVTCRDRAGQPVGITVNSFSSVSLQPPLVLWSLRRSSWSLEAFGQATAFAINILAEHQVDLSTRFARAGADKWSGLGWRAGAAGAPLLDDPTAVIECRTHAMHDAGDHRIFIGEVLSIRAGQCLDPLVFYSGSYRRLRQPDAA